MRIERIDNRKLAMLSGNPTMDPGFDEYDIVEKKEDTKMTIKELNELKKKYFIYDDVEEILDFVSELLHRRAKEIERIEPYATNTIKRLEDAAYEVWDLIDYISEMEEE